MPNEDMEEQEHNFCEYESECEHEETMDEEEDLK